MDREKVIHLHNGFFSVVMKVNLRNLQANRWSYNHPGQGNPDTEIQHCTFSLMLAFKF